jgi:hypothetical protein
MSNAPLMPMATAVWLVENTTLTFKQIADFCKLHEVEIQGIADGEVAKGIKAYNPIISGQLPEKKLNFHLKMRIDRYKLKAQILKFLILKKKLKNIFHFQKDKINQILLCG